MAARYVEPLEQAWGRTRELLLRPFDLERWIVLGFAAFLAGLAGGGWSSISFNFSPPGWRQGLPPKAIRLIERPWDQMLDFAENPLGLLLAAPLLLIGLVIFLALLWVGSRAKFVFLDGVVRGQAAIAEPWGRLAAPGNSLFLWRLGFLLGALVIVVVLLSPFALVGAGLVRTDMGRPLAVLAFLAGGLLGAILICAAAYVACFLESFVVPMMYSRSIRAAEAWRVLLPLLRRQPGDFALYGVTVLLGSIAVGVGYLLAAFATCCFVPMVLAIPYVGTVLLLPLHVLYRLYGIGFLAQFGPEYMVSIKREMAPATSSDP